MRRRSLLSLLALGSPLLGLSGAAMQRAGARAPSVPDDLCIRAPSFAWQREREPDMLAPREIPAEARCPVCGMFPARQPRWAVQVIHTDGEVHYLDSPLDLFHFLADVPRFAPGRTREGVAAIYVRDYADGRWLQAEAAVYLLGSKLAGPMRNGNLPAFGTVQAALAQGQGGAVWRFGQLAAGLPAALQRLAPHRH